MRTQAINNEATAPASSHRTSRRPRVLAAALLAGTLLGAVGCGGAASATNTSTTPSTAASTRSSNPSSSGEHYVMPAEALSLFDRAGATDAETSCLTDQSSLPAAVDCLSIETLVSSQSLWLQENTEFTPTMITCVIDRLRSIGVSETRRLVVEGIGEAVYVPCGGQD